MTTLNEYDLDINQTTGLLEARRKARTYRKLYAWGNKIFSGFRIEDLGDLEAEAEDIEVDVSNRPYNYQMPFERTNTQIEAIKMVLRGEADSVIAYQTEKMFSLHEIEDTGDLNFIESEAGEVSYDQELAYPDKIPREVRKLLEEVDRDTDLSADLDRVLEQHLETGDVRHVDPPFVRTGVLLPLYEIPETGYVEESELSGNPAWSERLGLLEPETIAYGDHGCAATYTTGVSEGTLSEVTGTIVQHTAT